MDLYGLAQLPGQLIAAVGGPLALLAVAVGGGAYIVNGRIAAKDAVKAQEVAAAIAKEQAMLAELAASREQINAFLTNHLEHLKAEREDFQRFQLEIVATNERVAKTLDGIEQRAEAHTQETIRKLDEIKTQ